MKKVFSSHVFPKQVYHQLYFMGYAPHFSPIYEFIRKETGSGSYDEPLPVFDVQLDSTSFLSYLKSPIFSGRCREILFILDQVNHDSPKIQDVALAKLHELLTYNVDIHNQIFYAKQKDIKVYENLSEIPLMLLPDGLDGESQYEPKTYTLLEEIETIGEFFSTLIVHLLRCLKFASRERALSVANCLGLLGAVDPKFLSLDKPCLTDFYKVITFT